MICSTCNIEKDISEYRKSRKQCKECQNKKVRENYKEKNTKYLEEEKDNETICCSKCNIDKNKKEHFRVNRKTCKDCERSHGRNYRRENKDKSKEWVENNRERMSELQSNWFQRNKNDICEQKKIRLKTDGEFKKINDYRSKIRHMIKSNSKYYDSIGCDSEHLKEWCELFFEYFENTTTIEDHGKIWVIDHVIPIKDIDEHNEIHILRWYNIMPALKKDNLKKNKYVDLEQIKRHLQVIEENKEYFSVDNEYINILAKHLDAGNSLET
jgi:hypothetical protein